MKQAGFPKKSSKVKDEKSEKAEKGAERGPILTAATCMEPDPKM